MFTFYIYDRRTSKWDEMFTIPSSGDFPIYNASINCSETSAESLSFTMESTSPYYDMMIPMQTLIRVMYDDECLFFGRVLSISTSGLFYTKQVTCSGALTFLNDTYYESTKSSNLKEITPVSAIEKFLDNHNDYTTETWKKFYKGTINVSDTKQEDKHKLEPTSWSDTYSCLKSVTDQYGGHFKSRYSTSEDCLYLDWYEYYHNDLGDGERPVVEVYKNILDLNSTSEFEEMFTFLIPIGGTNSSGNSIYVDNYKYTDKSGNKHTHSGKAIPVPLMTEIYSDSELDSGFHSKEEYALATAQYGKIYKTQSFSNANTSEKLWSYAVDWIKNNYFGLITSFTVKAIDMHIINSDSPMILVGDVVDCVYQVPTSDGSQTIRKKLVCKEAQYDLFNPENNSYTLGIPSDLINKEYGKTSTTSTSTSNDDEKNPPGEVTDQTVINFDWFHSYIGFYTDEAYCGTAISDSLLAYGEMSGTVAVYDEEEYRVNGIQTVVNADFFGKFDYNGSTYGVAYAANLGAFCYKITGVHPPYKVTHYYTRHKNLNTSKVEATTTVAETEIKEDGTVEYKNIWTALCNPAGYVSQALENVKNVWVNAKNGVLQAGTQKDGTSDPTNPKNYDTNVEITGDNNGSVKVGKQTDSEGNKKEPTVKIDGNANGKVSVGGNTNSKDNIELDGRTGVVGTKDVTLNDDDPENYIASLKTEFIKVRKLVADYIETKYLKAGGSVSSDSMTSHLITLYPTGTSAWSGKNKGAIYATHYYILDANASRMDQNSGKDLRKAIVDITKHGKYSLRLWTADGLSSDLNLKDWFEAPEGNE